MSPQLPQEGDDLEAEGIPEGGELVVFRVMLTDDPGSAAFVQSFKSRSELGLPPRRGTPEEAHPALSQGISVFESREAAIQTAKSVRQRGRDIGGYVAELRLTAGTGVRLFRWGARGHLTLWGDSLMLSQNVVDTIAID